MTKSTFVLVGLLAATTALAGCGESRGDRALSGAGIGAGVGALGGALTGGNVATGAVLGGAAGAAVGGFTNKDDINMGDPAWK
ncbi:MAG: hypothetical protein GC129_03995 [Proteobacteria bacterium]|nr:hypothetical protein [Pseudomonadota bacterium]